jgi:hypothetical protein
MYFDGCDSFLAAVIGTYRSPGNAGRVRTLGTALIALDQQLARVRRRIAGGA